jgi:hypothetical protein
MSATVYETEMKYEAPLAPPCRRWTACPVWLALPPQEQLLEAEYYDTDDMRLMRDW